MATSTGEALDGPDLLNKVSSAVLAQGSWTVNYFGPDPSNVANTTLNISGGGKFFNFMAVPSLEQIWLSISTAYSSGADWGTHPDDSKIAGINTTVSDVRSSGIPSYWTYITSDYVHVIHEVESKVYSHFGCGVLEKFGSYVGGEYVYGHYLSSGWRSNVFREDNNLMFTSIWGTRYNGISGAVRADFDGMSPNYLMIGGHYAANYSARGTMCYTYVHPNYINGLYVGLWDDGPSADSGREHMFPIIVYAQKKVNPDDPVYYNYPIGQVKGMLNIDIENLAPEDVVYDDWKVFPLIAKNGVGWSSQNFAVAYNENA